VQRLAPYPRDVRERREAPPAGGGRRDHQAGPDARLGLVSPAPDPAGSAAVELQDVRKRYPTGVVALDGVSLVVPEGRTLVLLALLRLDPDRFATLRPAQLSGGERQRVGLARALAADPPLLLMDEPFGALDPLTRRAVQDEFRELVSRLGKTVVLVTHDVPEA